jgi:hypothetical protein
LHENLAIMMLICIAINKAKHDDRRANLKISQRVLSEGMRGKDEAGW